MKSDCHKRSRAILWLLLLITPALAQDTAKLSELLAPAYTAMNYAVLCTNHSTWGISQPRGPHGTALQYAEHIKDEVIDGLTYKEALTVLKSAADLARSEAEVELKAKVIVGHPSKESQRLFAWCESFVSDFVTRVMLSHDRDHDKFLHGLVQAKKTAPR